MENNPESIDTGYTFEDLKRLYPIKRKAVHDPGALVRCCFYISGNGVTLIACNNATGIQPTKFLEQRVRGRFQPSGRPNVLPPQWSLDVKHEPTVELEPCMTEMLDLLWTRRAEIKDYVRASDSFAGFNANIIVYEQKPIVELTAPTLARLAEFGFRWNLDWQDVSS